jgi:Glycosyl hydrolase family 10
MKAAPPATAVMPRQLEDPRSGQRRRSSIALVALLLLVAAFAQPASGADTLRQAGARAGVLVGVGREPGNPADDRLALREFDALTLENSLIWSVVEPAPGRWDFRSADRSVAFARRHHLFLTATHFVWDQVFYSSTPARCARAQRLAQRGRRADAARPRPPDCPGVADPRARLTVPRRAALHELDLLGFAR